MAVTPNPPDRNEINRRKQRRSRLLIILVSLALGVPAGFVFAHAIHIPLVESLDNYQPSIITRVFDRNGVPFAEYAIQKRIVVAKHDMAPALVNAIVATEDGDFYHHGGVDPKAILRAGLKDLIARKKVEGASTLTQQLAKQVFLTPEKSIRRKVNEMFMAIEIEKNFTKNQIFELYANQVYLGHGAYGVESASRLYFGKHAKDLTLPEAAVLAGLIRSPMPYSPIVHPQQATARRNHVLRRMLEEKYIDRKEYDQALATPLVLGSYRDEAPKVGAYFSEEIRQTIEKSPKYGVEDLYRRGLKVYSTLDLKLQEVAERSLQRGLRNWDHRRGFRKPARNLVAEGIDLETYRDLSWDSAPLEDDKLYPAVVMALDENSATVRVGQTGIELTPASYSWTHHLALDGMLRRGDLVQVRAHVDTKTGVGSWYLDQVPQVQGAIVALDVKTGEVRAMVGGYDFAISKFNRAIQSRRQTGSSFKPFVYGAAFEKGLTPADTLFDAPISIPMGPTTFYAPKNYYGRYSGIVTIQRALELSINIPAVKTWMMIGGDKVIDFVRRCGITADIPPYPSTSLGAAGVSPLEMVAGYSVFANQGVYIKPRFIRKITDSTDKTLEEFPTELSEATQAQVAYELAWMLKGTVDRGTAYAAHVIPGAVAGKTGTTNGYTDAWFIGFSPEYCIGVWMGYDDPGRSLGVGATGAEVALPIWIDVFKKIDELKLRGDPKPLFEAPPDIVIVPMDLMSGRRGVGPCGRVVQEAFIAGQEPDKDCSGGTVAVSKLPFYLQRQFYQPKEFEPTQIAQDVAAQPGEGAESPAPDVEEPPATSTAAPPATNTAAPPLPPPTTPPPQ
jgi:penicillin-binding protein 1A